MDVLPATLVAFVATLGLYFLVALPLWRLGRYACRRLNNPLDRFDRWAERLGRGRAG